MGAAEEIVGGRLAVLDQAERENFPVASRVLPADERRALIAVYGYARLVDDVGDEAAADRRALLDAIERDVHRIYGGGVAQLSLVRDLAPVVRRFHIPERCLLDLIGANRQDQVVVRYRSYLDLLRYCTLSANPVGRMVLAIAGATSAEQVGWSDDVCTALQIVEHCQDVAEDFGRGRIYLPLEDLDRFGVTEGMLGGTPPTPRAVRELVAFEIGRAGGLLRSGGPLVSSLRGRMRLAVAGFVAGGRAACAALARTDYDVLAGPPARRRARLIAETARVLATGG